MFGLHAMRGSFPFPHGAVSWLQLIRASLLVEAAQRSVYKLYSVISQSQELNRFTASKTHPMETLRAHLIGVANWVLFLVRTRTAASLSTSAVLAGEPGGPPGPVAGDDHRPLEEPSLRGETRAT